MRIGIFLNKEQVEASDAEWFLSELRSCGAEAEIFATEDDIRGVDRLVVLGGDGTVLRAARQAALQNIPLFGVNYGHTGFLTEFDRTERAEAISLALSSFCDSLPRSMLEVEFQGKKTVCLNECSLLRSVRPHEESRVVKILATIDGGDAGEIVADGIIVSTPTGSTAYSLSAGGSIMTPACETFMLTPVCAFSMKSRPIVYSSSATLSFTVSEPHGVLLYGDGKYLGEVGMGEYVTVRRAARRANFLTRNKKSYLLRITNKIN